MERQILAKVEKCGKDSLWWNKNVFGNVRQELKKKKMLRRIANEAIRSGDNQLVQLLKAEINLHLDREARM